MKYFKPTKKMEGLTDLEQDAIFLSFTNTEIKINILKQLALTGHPVTDEDVAKLVIDPVKKTVREIALKEGYVTEEDYPD